MLRVRIIALIALCFAASSAFADATYQTLPFSQDWSNTGLITEHDNWSGVPGIVGYRGDGLTGGTNTDPQTILGASDVIDVNANQTNTAFATGGVAEFHIENPVVALQGSGTARAPYIQLHLNTTGFSNIRVKYNVRDIDLTDDAVQQVALQYRIGNSGNFINVPAGYIADATEANANTKVTSIDVFLPPAANNQAQLQVRVITSDAAGSDEWVGIDDIEVTGTSGSGQPVLTISDVTAPEGNSGTSIFSFTVSLDQTSASDVTFTVNTQDNTATVADNDYVPVVGGTGTIAAGSLTTTVNVTVNGDTAVEPTETFFVNISSIVGAIGGDVQGIGTITNDDSGLSCESGSVTFIHNIQGSGVNAALSGVQTIEGIVTAVFQGPGTLGGFFVQEEDGDADSDPATSEGIFVFSNIPASVGEKVRVQGTVTEFFGLTELTNVAGVAICGSGSLPAATSLTFPVPAPVGGVPYLERLEGMRIVTTQPLGVAENFDHGRFGELTLGLNGRLFIPTHLVAPGASAVALQDLNDRSRIVLDDNSSLTQQNIVTWLFPENGGLSASNTARTGELLDTAVEGILSFDFSRYRILPTAPVTFHAEVNNPRPAAPAPVGGRIRIAAFNVLNYFTTLNNSPSGCGPSGTLECRGANTAEEFTRQCAKIINAIVAMDPHVLGITEIENNNLAAIDDLVSGLNGATTAGKYAYISTGTIGTDAIRDALIYQPAVVNPVGTYAVLNTPAAIPSKNRPPLAQTFEAVGPKSALQRFTVSINHFKSKGSACTDTDEPGEINDPDTGDGQGNCNLTRTSVAQALADWLATNPTGDPTPAADRKIFIMGDLNAYKNEDPISALLSASFVNLIDTFLGSESYSYVFMGQSGYLDHALANPAASRGVTGVTEWHINADEPVATDYNTSWTATINKTLAQVSSLFAPTPYRSSDHDPVLLGFNPLCGDFNDDGSVDVADRELLTNKIGETATLANRRYNLDADGAITTNDYRLWLTCQRQFAQ